MLCLHYSYWEQGLLMLTLRFYVPPANVHSLQLFVKRQRFSGSEEGKLRQISASIRWRIRRGRIRLYLF